MLKSTIKHKNVEFTELFYDLVFVYAISKTTGLIHHLHDGIVGGDAFLTFLVTLFVLVDAWMLQTVFTNQYGKNSFLNISIMFIKMVILLVFSGMIVNDWYDHFDYLCWTFSHNYSTVTDFARFLGLSTSQPRARATERAKS